MIHIFNAKIIRFSIQFTANYIEKCRTFCGRKSRWSFGFRFFCRWSAEVILDEFITYTISFLISFFLALLAENLDTHLVGVCLPCGKSEFTLFTCFTVPLFCLFHFIGLNGIEFCCNKNNLRLTTTMTTNTTTKTTKSLPSWSHFILVPVWNSQNLCASVESLYNRLLNYCARSPKRN